MDAFTKNILSEWKLDELIEKFNEEEIGRDQFLTLTESMITELIPKVGKRSTFFSKFVNFIENQKVSKDVLGQNTFINDNPGTSFSEDTTTDDIGHSIDIQSLPFEIDDNSSVLMPSSLIMYESNAIIEKSIPATTQSTNMIPVIDPEKGNIVREILNKYQDGLMILQCYTAKGILNSAFRNSLTSVLVKHELQIEPNHQISKSKFLMLAEDDYEDRIQWLKNNVEPEHILFKYWQETSNFRNKKASLETHSYPALKKPTGYLLIEIDFEELYSVDKKILLFTKFDGFIIKLIKYIEKHNIKFGVQETLVLHELRTPSKSGNDTIAALKLIPFLFQPITLKLDKKRKNCNTPSTWRPSKVEQASAFVKFIADANELKTSHTQKIDKSIQFGTTLQPYVIIVGHCVDAYQEDHTPIESYTVINNTYYKLETPLKALDVCFKSYYSLNLQYPIEVQHIWTFVQQYFYEIHDKNDKNFPSVKTLINDLNHL
ncbi:hypothetical protein ACI65C_004238 [Semiaphis heraclei]